MFRAETYLRTLPRPFPVTRRFFEYAGGITLLFFDAIRYIIAWRYRPSEVVRQTAFLIVDSLPIVLLTSGFTGLVISLETAQSAVNNGFAFVIGGSVAYGTVRELGPLLTGIVFAGRAGAAITAQLGSMVVTEQIEALKSFGSSPTKVLVVPRLLACVIGMPLLTAFADIIAVYGGYYMAYLRAHISTATYWNSVNQFVDFTDFEKGLLKAAVFGVIVAIVACYEGLRTEGGADGVGRATTNAVVTSILLVFAFNFGLSFVLFK
ncbi:MAG TPA: ABC transporter permease [Candidatus Eremiobacteraceae bacterium]|jgi:phospholipid/cholesterol/gamma-HCH transport system permease protein|nr:ABC transporter permease [Candidatus Eremiobacteraceae bacterium]